MKMEQTECPETLAYEILKPGNYPEESIQYLHNVYISYTMIHVSTLEDGQNVPQKHVGPLYNINIVQLIGGEMCVCVCVCVCV